MEGLSFNHLPQITADLPQWPVVLTEKWLASEASRKGWPPDGHNDWKYVFGKGKTLANLQCLRWEKSLRELTPHELTPRSQELVINMFRGYYWRDTAAHPFSSFDGGRHRFESITSYLLLHHDYPWSPALEQRSNGLEILDGFHRCLAAFYLGGWMTAKTDDPLVAFDRYVVDYWVATSN